jgi:hypothetical protein
LTLVSSDDWEADSATVTNECLKASRRMNKSFILLYNFPFCWSPICKRTGVMC